MSAFDPKRTSCRPTSLSFAANCYAMPGRLSSQGTAHADDAISSKLLLAQQPLGRSRARAAARAGAPDRHALAVLRGRRANGKARLAALLQALRAVGLDQGPQPTDRAPAGSRAIRTTIAKTRLNWSRSRRTSIFASGGAAAEPLLQGNPDHTGCIRNRPRPGRRRLRRQPGAAGRQRHRVHDLSNTAWAGNGWNCSSRSRRA